MRVLIADDSSVMRMILERGLRASGLPNLEIVHAADGLQALAQVQQHEALGSGFDLILTDVHMPVMDGPEFLAEARRRGLATGVPVVLITAQDVASSEPATSRVGRLTKPFTLAQMQASLASLLEVPAHG